MLRVIVILVTLLSLAYNAQAQSLEFETLRTEHSPGFFELRIFPGPDLRPMLVTDQYVANFKDKKQYQPLIDVLTELNKNIITPEEAQTLEFSARDRVIWLGGTPPPNTLHFHTQTDDILTDFEVFSDAYLGPVYLTNLDLDFGGNASETYPERIKFLNGQMSVYGKFERPLKTRLTIQGTSKNGEIMATAPVYLNEYDPLSRRAKIAESWEKLATGHAPHTTRSDFWLNAFPWVLFLIGVGLIVLASIHFFREEDLILDEDWLDQPLEETPLYKDWESNLPFEVVEKD